MITQTVGEVEYQYSIDRNAYRIQGFSVQRGYPKLKNYTMDTTAVAVKVPTEVQLLEPSLKVADPRPNWDFQFTVDTISYWNYPIRWKLESEIILPKQLTKYLPEDYTGVRVVCRMDFTMQVAMLGEPPEIGFTDLSDVFGDIVWLRETQRSNGLSWSMVRWFAAYLKRATDLKYGCDITYSDAGWESGLLRTNITTEMVWYQAKLQLKYVVNEPAELVESKRYLFSVLPYYGEEFGIGAKDTAWAKLETKPYNEEARRSCLSLDSTLTSWAVLY